MKNTTKYVIFIFLLFGMISLAAAADVDDSTSNQTTTATIAQDTADTIESQIVKTVDNNNKKNNIKESTRGKTIIVNSENYTQVFGSSGLDSSVDDGDTIDIQQSFVYNSGITIDKAVTITTTNNSCISLNTTSGSYTGNETGNTFNIINSGSYTNITNLKFYNTQIFVKNAHHVTMDNVNVTVNNQRIGSGVGVTSIRENSSFVTVKNSYFHTCNNSGSSSLVLSWADNCTIDNNTIIGEGNIGNLMYLTTYNIPGIDYRNVSINTFNNITNNRIYTINLIGGSCVGVVVSGHNNTFEANNVSVPSAFSGQWISPTATPVGDFNDTYEGNSYINNWVNGIFTGTKNSTISGNIFLGSVSIPDRCKFRYNNASTVTVTVTGPDGCLKGNIIDTLTVKPAANVTYNCTGNIVTHIGTSGRYMQNCTCTECNNANILLKKSSRNVKTDGEVTVVKEWQVSGGYYDENNNWAYVEFTETFATLYSNGTLIVDVTEHVLYPNGRWGGSGEYSGLSDRPWAVLNQWAGEYTVKDIILNERYPEYYSGAIGGGGLLGVGYDNSNEEFPNLMNVDTYTVNCYVQDPDFSYDPSFIDHTPFKHMTINNLVGGTGVNYHPIIFGKHMGVSPNIETLTFNNFEYTNTKGLWIENVPEVNFINSKITLKSNMTIKNSTVNFINSELNIEYETDDDTYIPTDYAIDVDGNLNIENSIITIKNLKEIKLGSNNNITKNTITTDSENTIVISGSNNIVTGNTLTSKEKTGDDTVIVSLEGENNIIDNSDRTATKVTIIAPEKININEEVPVTILFQDVDGQLLANDYISIIVGDADPEPVQTDENGMYIYTLTATQPGTLTFTVEVDKSKKHFENSTSKEFIVNEDKDAIIAELNNTIQEQNDKINELTEQNAALNDTINSQAERIDDLEEQIGQLTAAKATTLTLDPVTDVKYNTNVTITGTLVNEDGIALSNQVVTITIGEKTADVKTRNGEFKYTTSFKTLDEQTVTASYAGSDKYLASEDTASFTPEKGDVVVTFNPITDVKYGENVTIAGKFTTSDGKAISNSNVKITINGRKYYAKTDKTGAFTLSAKVTVTGENEVTIGYSGNTNYNAYETTTMFNVEKQDVTVTYEPINDVTVGENVTITGTFTDVNGNAVKNSNVKIIIDGKKYYAKTDSNGVYTFTAAMTKAGVKTVSIGYSGNTNYNEYTCETTFTVLEKA